MKLVQEDTSQALTDAAKNWFAMDGLWFQAVEQAYGMETALAMDREVWKQFAVIEARRIKERLELQENGGLEALETAFTNRLATSWKSSARMKTPSLLPQKPAGCRMPDKERGRHCFLADP